MRSPAQLQSIPATIRARQAARAGMAALALYSAGHFFVDLYSGALAGLQPLLVGQFSLTFQQAGTLGGILVFSSSVMQPFYGFLSDRFRSRLFSALGPAMAGLFISCLGLAAGYGGLVAMALLGGAGIAAFHPQASSQATVGVQGNRGRAMAVFISSGTLGMALGPTYFSIVSERLGLRGTWVAALPGLIVSAVLVFWLPQVAGHVRRRSDWSALRACWKPIAVLYVLVFLRSAVQITFTHFIPLYLHFVRGYPVATASFVLSLYLAFGAAGGFLGGHLSDRFGGRFVIILSMIGSVPFLALFFLTEGWLSLAGLMAGGLALLFTIPVNVVMAQELVPSQAGTVSALMMGFGWGMAGLIFMPLTGWASDHYSMHNALMALLAFPVIGFFLSLRLPK